MTKRMKDKNKHHLFHSNINFSFEQSQYSADLCLVTDLLVFIILDF